MEAILTGGIERFSVFPIDPKYQDLWDLYKTHKKAFWVAEEINYNADLDQWEKLNEDEKYFIEHILAFFAGSDGIVLENLVNNFSSEVKISEARAFYAFQAMIENEHSLCYALLIDTFIKDPVKKAKLFNAIEEIPVIEKKAKWAMKWMNKSISFGIRLVAFAIVEGIFFSGAFCSIFWLKDNHKMIKALGHSNELIARDEGLHTQFAVTLFHHLENKPDNFIVSEMVQEAVQLEKEFINEAIPCRMIGMNVDLMSQYIEFVADRLIVQLGYIKIYNSECPFDFMNRIGIDNKTNFFEKRVSEYTVNMSTMNDTDFTDDNIEF
jgi:ribonucleotide reductase beta subunit family protein with ferritin-like domain